MTDLMFALGNAVDHLEIAMDILDDVSESRADQDTVILDEMMRVGYVLDAARGLLRPHPRVEDELEAEQSERIERDQGDSSGPP